VYTEIKGALSGVFFTFRRSEMQKTPLEILTVSATVTVRGETPGSATAAATLIGDAFAKAFGAVGTAASDVDGDRGGAHS
jgi:hypothetical protein